MSPFREDPTLGENIIMGRRRLVALVWISCTDILTQATAPSPFPYILLPYITYPEVFSRSGLLIAARKAASDPIGAEHHPNNSVRR